MTLPVPSQRVQHRPAAGLAVMAATIAMALHGCPWIDLGIVDQFACSDGGCDTADAGPRDGGDAGDGLGDGGVSDAGGADGGGPASGEFRTLSRMSAVRAYGTATVLRTGKVLLVGCSDPAAPCAELFAPAAASFEPAGALNFPRTRHSATLLADGNVLITGGRTPLQTSYVTASELYDPVTNAFAPFAPLTTSRARHTSLVLGNGDVLVLGGVSESTVQAPPAWERLPLWGGAFVASPSTAAWADILHTALPSGRVLLSGGFRGLLLPSPKREANLYRPETETTPRTGGNPAAAYGGGAAVRLPDGTVLLTGGQDETGSTVATAEIFEPATETFRLVGPMLEARAQHRATLLGDGLVLVTGGEVDAAVSRGPVRDSTELYDWRTGRFERGPRLNAARANHTAVLLAGGRVLLAGGLGYTVVNDAGTHVALSSAEVFLPVATGSAEARSVSASPIAPRLGSSVTLLPNGQVLLAGGRDTIDGGAVPSSALYDPVAGTTTATGSMNAARVDHTATLLSEGLVLVTGGDEPAPDGGPSAELYTPRTGTFTRVPMPAPRRRGHTASLLGNGLVLIAGGADARAPGVAALLFNPRSGDFRATDGGPGAERAWHTASPLPDGTVLLAGGVGHRDQDGGAAERLSHAERYDPRTDTFLPTGGLLEPRSHHSAVVLPTGDILVSGGHSPDGGVLTSQERYDWSSQAFVAVDSPLAEGRARHAAAVLPGGRIAIIGGEGGASSLPIASFELFGHYALSALEAGQLPSGVAGHSAIRLPDGRLLIAGGATFDGGWVPAAPVLFQ